MKFLMILNLDLLKPLFTQYRVNMTFVHHINNLKKGFLNKNMVFKL